MKHAACGANGAFMLVPLQQQDCIRPLLTVRFETRHDSGLSHSMYADGPPCCASLGLCIGLVQFMADVMDLRAG